MNIADLIITDTEKTSLDDIFLDAHIRLMFQQLIKEHSYVNELRQYGLPVNNKLLLYGSSGCGKTTTAKAIAHALGKNLLVLNLSNVICSRIGETAQNLKMVFDKAAREKAVLFLDEFDQIGKSRSIDDKDVGELRRLVNTMIQLIDYYPQESLLICATNHQKFIDPALIRRFQLRVSYTMPAHNTLDDYYESILSRFPEHLKNINRKYDISFAEARDYALTSVKSALITELEQRNNLAGV